MSPKSPLSDEEIAANIEYYSGGPPVSMDVPAGCIAVRMHGFSYNSHWAGYEVHKTAFTYSPRFGQARILKPGESMTFPWCPLTPDEDFNFRFREVTITNENGTTKETNRITDIVPCDYD